jgi:alkanesulfonate monooxygenase SsuD/methylene tetrahydromethanopterin reductase-like flavin-dependent oxidoreductase (luciferase family)
VKFASFSHVWNKPGLIAAQRYEELWRELALCDELGFDYGFAVEHHFSPHESWMPSPTVYCTGGAARTRRMRLGPMGYVVPLYDPIRIVEEVAVLDHVLNGRLEVGLVAGIVPSYFGPYKADFENRRALATEGLALIKAAFASSGAFSFEGPFHQYRDVKLSVSALQKPHPPLWMQSRDPDTLEVLAHEGVHTGYLLFMPREDVAPRYRQYLRGWRQAGHAHRPNIGYWTLVHVDETDAKAVATATPHIVHAFGQVFGFGDVGGIDQWQLAENYVKRGELGAAEIARNMTSVEYLLKRNVVFVGSPDTVARRIREAAEEGLFNTVFCEFNLGSMSEETLLRSIRLFGTEVIPALRGFEPY